MAFGLVLAFLGATSAHAATPSQFTYRVQVPASSIDCTQQAKEVGSAFGNVTRLSGVQATCQGVRSFREGDDSFGIATIVVTYQAQTELQPTRSVFGGAEFLGEASAQFPLFDTYKNCLAQLKTQEVFFETEAQTEAVAAHCDAANDGIQSGYSLTIETFGAAKRRLYAFMPALGVNGPQPGSQVLAAAKKALKAVGADLAYSDDRRVFFYSQYDQPILVTDFGTFSDASECSDQLAEASAVFSHEGIDASSAFCEPEAGGSVTLTAVGAGLDVGLPVTESDRYSSYAECKADRARVVANETSAGRTVTGAVCAVGDVTQPGQYQLDLYFANN
jgi:hypothetical protein